MRIPILNKTEANDLHTFISFWSKLYSYRPGLEHLYKDAIDNKQYDEKDIQAFFTWKNGMKLSSGKQTSLNRKIKSKLSIINKLKASKDFEVTVFSENFKNLTVVWKIFLLHIINPKKYPIYDQHIHRTYNFIHGLPYNHREIEPLTEKEKERFYFDEYLAFIDTINGIGLKTIDEAFFVFGQFLKTNGNAKLVE